MLTKRAGWLKLWPQLYWSRSKESLQIDRMPACVGWHLYHQPAICNSFCLLPYEERTWTVSSTARSRNTTNWQKACCYGVGIIITSTLTPNPPSAAPPAPPSGGENLEHVFWQLPGTRREHRLVESLPCCLASSSPPSPCVHYGWSSFCFLFLERKARTQSVAVMIFHWI